MDGTIVEVSIFLFCLKCFTFHYNYLQWGDCYNFPLLRTVFLSSPLFMIILFSLLIRFQVLILLDASQVCTSFMMILRHLMTVIKRTIFVGGIVWDETLQLMGFAPVLVTFKIEFYSFFFPLHLDVDVFSMTWHLHFIYNAAIYAVNQILAVPGWCLIHMQELCMITWEEWKIS